MNSVCLQPVLGHRRGRGGHRLLMICYYDPSGLSTIRENIANWQQFSRFQIEVINLWPGRDGAALQLPGSLELVQYAGVVIHSTVAYWPVNLFALDERLARPFEEFDGVKILMKQDEQVETNRFVEYIGKKKVDIVITCVSPGELENVYPRSVIGDVDFIHAWTGYVSPSLRSLGRRPVAQRPMDITYRGSIQPLEFGRLGYEKRGIGYDVAAATRNVPRLKADISSRWEDRINGTAWFDFLCQSKVVLGAESGSNLFDFTGEVASWCRAYERRDADLDRQSKDFYLCAHEEYLHRFEGNVNYATISPRHFEAAACGSAQILYDGEYSGILLRHRHFFPLKRSLSNLDEALDFARDDRRLKETADCAYEEIIGNPEHHYEHFVEQFDCAVEQRKQRKQQQRSGPKHLAAEPSIGPPAKALLLVAHEPTLDPRVDWFAEGLASDFEVCEVGIEGGDAEATPPTIERLSARRTRVRINGHHIKWDSISPDRDAQFKTPLGLSAMERLFILAQLPIRSLGKAIGALDATEEDLARFRRYCNYFVNTNSALLEASRLIGGFDVVVAADLDTLPAGVALSEEYDVPLIYDAHEYWPYAFPAWRHWETEFWSDLERTLLKRVTLPLTVSPQLATIMSRQYGCAFDYIPNCAPLGSEPAIDLEAALAVRAQSRDVIFLVQGRFGIDRGFEKLINAWSKVEPHTMLWLRGPDGSEKTAIIELAQSRGLLNKNVFFPDAVAEADLVRSARDADIGLVPYEPTCLNNRYCSPNKLSQYMAAGLPILCNELDFVKSIVVGNGVGAAVDFNNEAALVRTINEFVLKRDLIPALSRKSQELFRTTFNWQRASRKVYINIKDIVYKNRPKELGFDFAWVDDPNRRHLARELSAHERQNQELGFEISQRGSANKELGDEIQRLNLIYMAEIERLHEVYTKEIEKLRKSKNNLSRVGRFGLRIAARPFRAISKILIGARGGQ